MRDGDLKKTVYDIDNFNRFQRSLLRNNKDFIMEYSGSMMSICYKGYKYVTFADKNKESGKGFHLVNMVKKDIDLLFKEKDVPVRNWDYKEQYFNIDAIEAFSGNIAVSIDISDCYWTTAFKLGFITERTYVMGKKKGKDWKIGRVASIGALAKRKVIRVYKGGQEVVGERMAIDMPLKYQYARHNIIGYVYDKFKQLYMEIGDGYLMYLTDCVVVEPRYLKYVRRFLTDNGYRFKEKHVEILGVDKVNNAVHWYEYPDVNEHGEIDVNDKGKNKYYQYSKEQLVFDVKNIRIVK